MITTINTTIITIVFPFELSSSKFLDPGVLEGDGVGDTVVVILETGAVISKLTYSYNYNTV